MARIKEFLVKQGLVTGEVADSTPTSSPLPISPQPVARATTAGSAGVDAEYVAKLREILDGANISGINELLAQMQVFEKVPGMDEATRMRAAFAGLESSKNFKKGDLLKAAQARLDFLAQQKENFARDVDSRRSSEIGGKNAEKQQATAKIEELRKQVAELEGTVRTLDSQIQAEESHLARQLSAFNSAYAVVEAEERAQMQKINQFIN